MQETASGLKYEVLSEGSGARPTAQDTVVVHYTGTLADGSVFDSSRERGEPARFPLNAVIPGWTEGLQLMCAGGRYKFVIPSNLGYGEAGSPPVIPANAELTFDVELLEIAAPPEPSPVFAAFLERGIPTPACGAMPTATGDETAEQMTALHEQGNAWQDCIAAYIKDSVMSVQTDLGKLNAVDPSTVPDEQSMQVRAYLQAFSRTLQEVESALYNYKGISKS